MKIGIVGKGAIGTLLAARAYAIGADYSVITRDGMAFSIQGKMLDNKPLQISPPICNTEQIAHLDVIILPIKAYQIIPAIKQLAPQLHPAQIIMLLHNGMGTTEPALSLIPNAVIEATTSHAAYIDQQGCFHHTGMGKTDCGWVRSSNDRQSQAQECVSELLPPCDWHDDVMLPLLYKLAINGVINPLTAIYQVNNGELREERFSKIKRQLCQESASILHALGYHADPDALLKKVNTVIEDTSDNYSSMFQDLANGRLTEIDAISGYLCQQAELFDVEAKTHQQMLHSVQALQQMQAS
jgi:2-dehydropantoate 2-reductase